MGAANKNWNGKVLYQIYPRSFKDSNNDGIGDINGITSKLEYLAGKPSSLGIDIIWISPFYPSPMADFGYDIKNYKDIDKIFGNLNDFNRLIKKAHSLGLKVLVDFVPNHTSDEHPWFKESRSSKNSQKRDWYVWMDGKQDGSPPNNWQSVFGGSAWQLDNRTNQYYLHSFHKKQPDLNWANKKVVTEMQKILKFWLDLGVDGFRVDAISWISKDGKASDDKVSVNNDSLNSYDQLLHDKSMHYGQLYKKIDSINQVVKSYENTFVIYEYYKKPQGSEPYKVFYEHTDSSVCSPFNFSLIINDWDYSFVKNTIKDFFTQIKSEHIPVFCIGNHDSPRVIDRIGERAAKQAAVLTLTLPGIPTIYYGDELGMHNEYVADENIKDPFEKLQPNKNLGRDPSRAAMHWNNTNNHGFSEHDAWLKSYESYPSQAYSTELRNPKSFLNLYKILIHLRKNQPALALGDYKNINFKQKVFGYYREVKNNKLLILNNFGPETTLYIKGLKGRVILSTHRYYNFPVVNRIIIKKNESIIIKIKLD